jgi:uncharacterized membrane protein YtjA (UPF0391 family)
MLRLAFLSLALAILSGILGLTGLAGDFAGLSLILFGIALAASGTLFGLRALERRDERRCYN